MPVHEGRRAAPSVAETRDWLLETCLPAWARLAVDPEHGGYVSDVRLGDGKAVLDAPKHCLVQARLLYVFSHAHLLGAGGWALEAASEAEQALARWFRGPDGGWRRAVTRDGRPSDDTRDFYDQAFVLFGLAWWHRASGDRRALDRISETIGFMDARLADPAHGGYHEALERPTPRRQNPHMHLLEALHALHEATRDPAWLARAAAIVKLFQERFYDAATGSLREYVGLELQPLISAQGHVREPGHHMEWVWLLLHHRRLTGDDGVLAPAERLYRSAAAHGIDERGLLVEAMNPEGTVLQAASLLWPQTEAIKACLARREFLGADPHAPEQHVASMWAHHISDAEPLWINRLEADSTRAELVPTRVLYHLVLALAERIRLG